MTLPNFLVIGAAKAGTTSLYQYLRQHPQIYLSPVKETNFFSFEGDGLDYLGGIGEDYRNSFRTSIEAYIQEFEGVTNEIAIGEVSPSYLYISQSADRIKHYLKDVKLIAILRNPVDRAYSHFLHHVRDRFTVSTNFLDALQAEETRIQNRWWWDYHYIAVGRYAEQLKRYFSRFEREQIKIYLYEDLLIEPDIMLKDIFHFLEVDDTFTAKTTEKYNSTGIPKNRFLDFLIKERNPVKTVYQSLLPASVRKGLTSKISGFNPLVKPSLPAELRQQLTLQYTDEILELQNLIGRDLTQWMKVQ